VCHSVRLCVSVFVSVIDRERMRERQRDGVSVCAFVKRAKISDLLSKLDEVR